MAELRGDASAGRDAHAADAGPDRRPPQLHERGPDGVPASEPRIAGEHGVRSQGHCGASRHDADPGRDPAHRTGPGAREHDDDAQQGGAHRRAPIGMQQGERAHDEEDRT